MDDIIIGIDPGTVVTGYGIIRQENGIIIPIDYGCIRPPRDMELSDRYYAIFTCLKGLLERFSPTALAVETQYVSKNVQSALKLGMARGVVIIAAKSYQIPVFEYAPSKAKSAVVGSGKASKEQVQTMVQRMLRLKKAPPEDASDALAIAIAHLHMSKMPPLLAVGR